MSDLAVNNITDRDGGSNAILHGVAAPVGGMNFRNRIINGDMRIAQRGTAAVSIDNTFPVDRFRVRTNVASATFTAQQSATTPVGFVNSLVYTTGTGATASAAEIASLLQTIEGTNVSDLGFGTANAQVITLSFWVRSSVTGTFVATLRNGANDRNYPATYTVSSADTWEYKTLTIQGDTSGTWLTTNGAGLTVWFDLGSGSNYNGTAGAWTSSTHLKVSGSANVVGTSGATFYITGVQLEAGSVATPFERVPYGTQLALCQRYYYKLSANTGTDRLGVGWNQSTTQGSYVVFFPVTMRTNPTALEQSGTAGDYSIRHTTTNTTCSSVPIFNTASPYTADVILTVSSGLTAGQASVARAVNLSAFFAWSAEL